MTSVDLSMVRSVLRWAEELRSCVSRRDFECVEGVLWDIEREVGGFTPLFSGVHKCACGNDVYAPERFPIAFPADWWVEFDTLPLIDDALLKWVVSVSLLLPSHNSPDTIGLAVSTWRDWVRVHILMRHNEEYDALGVNILTALALWLKEVWGAKDVDVSYLSENENALLTFLFESFRDLPKGVRDLISYAGYCSINEVMM